MPSQLSPLNQPHIERIQNIYQMLSKGKTLKWKPASANPSGFPRARPFLPAYAFHVVIIHCRASANIKWSPALQKWLAGIPCYWIPSSRHPSYFVFPVTLILHIWAGRGGVTLCGWGCGCFTSIGNPITTWAKKKREIFNRNICSVKLSLCLFSFFEQQYVRI